MTFPRALTLLVPVLVVVGLGLLFLREGPSPRPGDDDGEGPPAGAPGEIAIGARPGERLPEPAAPPVVEPTPAAPVPAAPPTPTPREAQAFRAFDEAGAPVAGADVEVLDDLPDVRAVRRGGAERPPRATGVTGPDGAYVVAADAPRAGAVRVRARGFVEEVVGLEPFPSEIRLARARAVRVRVIDPRGQPVAGATVRAVAATRDVEVTTGADGRADLLADGTGWRRLEAFAEGFAVRTQDLTLEGPPRDGPVVFVLEPAAPIAGRVVADEDGAPIAGARVSLVSGAVERGVFATTTTGSDGRFTLSVSPPPGVVAFVDARAPDRLRRTREVSPQARSADLPELRLERGRVVSGLVRDGAGVPLAGVPVRALEVPYFAVPDAEDAPTLGKTDGQGRFEVRAPADASSPAWHVVARGPQGTWGVAPVPAATDTPLVIVLEGLGLLEGRVVSADGAGLAGVRVRPSFGSRPEDWAVGQEVPPSWDGGVPLHALAVETASTLTAPGGGFRLGPLPAGEVLLSIEVDGAPIGRWVPTRVVGERTTVLDPIVLPAGALSGVVLDGAGVAVAGAFVRLERVGAGGGEAGVRDTRTDAMGRFRFLALDPAEAVSLHVVGPAGTSARLDGVKPRAEPVELRLRRRPHLQLKVTRGGELYEGPLRVAYRPATSSGATSERWVMCVVGHVSLSVPSATTYHVEVHSAETEPASASGVTQPDPADRSLAILTLDLRVPEPAVPDGGMPGGR